MSSHVILVRRSNSNDVTSLRAFCLEGNEKFTNIEFSDINNTGGYDDFELPINTSYQLIIPQSSYSVSNTKDFYITVNRGIVGYTYNNDFSDWQIKPPSPLSAISSFLERNKPYYSISSGNKLPLSILSPNGTCGVFIQNNEITVFNGSSSNLYTDLNIVYGEFTSTGEYFISSTTTGIAIFEIDNINLTLTLRHSYLSNEGISHITIKDDNKIVATAESASGGTHVIFLSLSLDTFAIAELGRFNTSTNWKGKSYPNNDFSKVLFANADISSSSVILFSIDTNYSVISNFPMSSYSPNVHKCGFLDNEVFILSGGSIFPQTSPVLLVHDLDTDILSYVSWCHNFIILENMPAKNINFPVMFMYPQSLFFNIG